MAIKMQKWRGNESLTRLVSSLSVLFLGVLMILNWASDAAWEGGFVLNPAAASVTQGQNMQIDVQLQASEEVVSAEVFLSYDRTKLLVDNISFGNIFTGYVDNSVGGEVRVIGLSGMNEAFSGSDVMFSVSFVGAARAETTPVSFLKSEVITKADSQVVDVSAQGGTYEVTEQAPSAPTHITATDAETGGRIKVTWVNPVTGFDTIRVYRSQSAGTLGERVYSDLQGTSIVDSGLQNGTEYFYTVRSVTAAGTESVNKTQISATPSDQTPPDAPTGLQASAPAQTVNLTWNASVGASNYKIYQSTTANFGFVEIGEVASTSFADAAPSLGVTNYYRVTALDAAGNESDPATANVYVANESTSNNNQDEEPGETQDRNPEEPDSEEQNPETEDPITETPDEGEGEQDTQLPAGGGEEDEEPTPEEPGDNNAPNESIVTPDYNLNPNDEGGNEEESAPKQGDGQVDSDNDGLADELEKILKTDPNNPDTDADGRRDGEEVLDFETDPLQADEIDLSLPKVTNLNKKKAVETPDATPVIKGFYKPDTLIRVYAQARGQERILLGETRTDANGKFILIPEVELPDGEFEIIVEAVLEEGTKVINQGFLLKVNSTLNIPAPIIKWFNNEKVNGAPDQKLISDTAQPEIAGITYSDSEVVPTWQSLIFTSALIADSESGDFVVSPPEPLENGEHRVVIYATTADGLRSESTELRFEVQARTLSQNLGANLFDILEGLAWKYVIPGLAGVALILYLLVFWKRKKDKQKEGNEGGLPAGATASARKAAAGEAAEAGSGAAATSETSAQD